MGKTPSPSPLLSLPVIQQAVLLSLIAAVTIAAGTITGDLAKIPGPVTASFSYFTSGLLFGLVGLKLIPQIFEKTEFVKAPGATTCTVVDALNQVEKGGAATGYVIGAGLMIGMAYLSFSQVKHNRKKAEPVVVAPPTSPGVVLVPLDKAKGVFPYGTIVAYLVIVLTNGVIVGITTDTSRPVGLAMAITIAIELFFSATEKTSLIKERERSWYDEFIVALVAVGVVMAGAAIGSVAGKSRDTKGGAYGYFFLISFAIAAAQSMIMDAHARAVAADPDKVWPSTFAFVGMFVLLIIDWTIPGRSGIIRPQDAANII